MSRGPNFTETVNALEQTRRAEAKAVSLAALAALFARAEARLRELDCGQTLLVCLPSGDMLAWERLLNKIEADQLTITDPYTGDFWHPTELPLYIQLEAANALPALITQAHDVRTPETIHGIVDSVNAFLDMDAEP